MIDTNKIKNVLRGAAKLSQIYGSRLNLGFSGGKDSVVLKYFADYYGIDYVANFNNTQIERYKGMIRFIKDNYPDVNIIHPDKKDSFFNQMKRHGLPSIFRRWCCDALKHSNPKLKEYSVNILGVRAEESSARMKRGMTAVLGNSKRAKSTEERLKKTFAEKEINVTCGAGKDKVNIYPLFDITEKETYEIIRVENLIIPDVYYTSCRRLGCAFCPFATLSENMGTIKEQPSIARAWIRVLDDKEFQKKTQKNIVGKTNGAGIFFMYINKKLLNNGDLIDALSYLNSKDLFGYTGLQRFESFLKENNVL